MRVIRRAELATPATNEKFFAKAAASRADLVFLDLEDSVPPSHKEGARAMAVKALTSHEWGRTARALRINAIDTEWAYNDIISVVVGAGDALDTIVVPKVATAEDVRWVARLLDQIELGHKRSRPVRLEVLIEIAEGVANVDAIARSTPRLDALIFGCGDYSASLDAKVDINFMSSDYPGDLWHYARQRILVAARGAGIAALDGPYLDFANPDGFRDESIRARAMGFEGKWAIHPSQIDIANSVFSPSSDEITAAERIVELCEEMDRTGVGAIQLDGKLLDVGAVRAAEWTIERARAMTAAKT